MDRVCNCCFFKEGAYEVVLLGGVGSQSSHLPVCLVWMFDNGLYQLKDDVGM